jgi:DNA-binding transcriptional LysR family regulator
MTPELGEGGLFLERCRRIFSEIEAAELELSQTHEAPRGTLRVSLPLVGMLTMPTLVAFMRAYPEIILDLDFSDRVVDVIEEGFDAVVRFVEDGNPRHVGHQARVANHTIRPTAVPCRATLMSPMITDTALTMAGTANSATASAMAWAAASGMAEGAGTAK